jgi:cytosine/adenosine deaminase-related metal-dependent hydrolase
MAKTAYAAPWVLTGKPDAAPLRDGAVVFDADGRVLEVGARAALEPRHADARWQAERAILMPGLVNAHVHLELSALRGETRSGGGFGPWVASMMEKRDRLLPEQDAEAIDAAISELLRSGTVAIGEVTNTLAAVPMLGDAPLLGCVFHEIFGLRREAAEHMLQAAEQARAALARWPSNLSYALSPHTLYSLHPELVRELLARGQRTSLHLAEHAAERAYLRDGSGPFAEFLRGRQIPAPDWPPPGLSPVAYARQLGALTPQLIAVHLCATTRDELAQVAASGAHAVLCPRSNLFIELKLPPLFDVLEAGLRPGLGTDSLASNTSLDVLAEAAALRDRFPQVDAKLLFSMATWYGAVALGLSQRVGALAPGLAPGLLAVDIAHAEVDPLPLLLRSPPPARRVLLRPALPTPARPLGGPP